MACILGDMRVVMINTYGQDDGRALFADLNALFLEENVWNKERVYLRNVLERYATLCKVPSH